MNSREERSSTSMLPFDRMQGVHGLIALASALSILAGCTVGPNYARPAAQTPTAYKESEGWKVAQPGDEMKRGKWWEIFGDPRLNALQEQVVISNQNVLLAESNFRQARALVQESRSAYYPTASVGVGVTRSKASSTLGTQPVAPGALTIYSLPADVSWEPDIWGKVRRSVEASRASAQASAADLESVELSARAELAQDYFHARRCRRAEAIAGCDGARLRQVPATHQEPICSGCRFQSRRRSGGGAAEDHASAGNRCRCSARAAGACHRAVDREASVRLFTAIDRAGSGGAARTNGFAIAIARTSARYRRCRATRRSGERADRRDHRRVLSHRDIRLVRRFRDQQRVQMADHAEPILVDRR